MPVFDFQETPEPAIIMAYYPLGNIAKAGITDEGTYVSSFGQILDGLSYLHAKGIAHRDLKPENFVVEVQPFFKVVITDFGLAKATAGGALLDTFCGSLKYTAPEVFPGHSSGYGPPVDVWSLGVIVFEWIYRIPNLPDVPMLKGKKGKVSPQILSNWIDRWAQLLLQELDDLDHDKLVRILAHMLIVKVKKRWSASRCLAQGFKHKLFKRRVADGQVTYGSDPSGFELGRDDLEKGSTAVSPSGSGSSGSVTSESSASRDSEATTVLLGNTIGG